MSKHFNKDYVAYEDLPDEYYQSLQIDYSRRKINSILQDINARLQKIEQWIGLHIELQECAGLKKAFDIKLKMNAFGNKDNPHE